MPSAPDPAEPVDPWEAAEAEADARAEAGQPATLEDAVVDIIKASMAGGQRATCPNCGASVLIVRGRYAAHTRPTEGDACRDTGRPVDPEQQ